MMVHVDDSLCVASGFCVKIAPEVFRLEGNERSMAYVTEVPPELEEKVRRAAAACPVGAIIITED